MKGGTEASESGGVENIQLEKCDHITVEKGQLKDRWVWNSGPKE